jgi:hypothetical protein
MNKRLQYQLTIYGLSAVVFVSVFAVGYKTFLKKSADTLSTTGNTVSNSASVIYTDQNNSQFSENSNAVDIKVVDGNVVLSSTIIGNRSVKDKDARVELIDSATAASVGTINFKYGSDNTATVNLASIANISADKAYFLRLTIPNFLPKKVQFQLGVNNAISLTNIAAGDIAGPPYNRNTDTYGPPDGVVNRYDNAYWKKMYFDFRDKGIFSTEANFNGDTKIDLRDYDMSYGSTCYNVNETDQETKCQ